jgi:hypothetical protein
MVTGRHEARDFLPFSIIALRNGLFGRVGSASVCSPNLYLAARFEFKTNSA